MSYERSQVSTTPTGSAPTYKTVSSGAAYSAKAYSDSLKLDQARSENSYADAVTGTPKQVSYGSGIDLDYRKLYSPNMKTCMIARENLNGTETVTILQNTSGVAHEVGTPLLKARNSASRWTNERIEGITFNAPTPDEEPGC